MTRSWGNADIERAIAFLKSFDPITWERYVAAEKSSQHLTPDDVDHIWMPLSERAFPDSTAGEASKLVEKIRDKVRTELRLTTPKVPLRYLPPEHEWTAKDADRAVSQIKHAAEPFSELWKNLLTQESEQARPDRTTLDKIFIFLERHFQPVVRTRFFVSLVELIRDRARAELGLAGPRLPLEGGPMQRLWTLQDLVSSISCLQEQFPEIWKSYLEEEKTTGYISNDIHFRMEAALSQALFRDVSFREMGPLFTLIREKIRGDLGLDVPRYNILRLK